MNADLHGNPKSTGFALPATLFALLVLGGLVTGGFITARQESRIATANRNSSTAAFIADEGITGALTGWSDADFHELSVGSAGTVSGTTDQGRWTVEVLKTSDRGYFVTSTGEVTRGGTTVGGARHRLGLLVRVFTPELEPPAAIATRGEMVVAGSSVIEGHDTDPSDWTSESCPGPAVDKPGILINDSTNVSRQGGAHEIAGDPPIAEDPSITSQSLLDFGDTEWGDLVAMADKAYPHGSSVTNTVPDSVSVEGSFACRTSTLSNWGDPRNPGASCFDYFPIIHAEGDMEISSSAAGQGILLVDGDLRIRGGFEFFGIVIVKGTISTSGTGGHVNGGVIAASADLDTSTVTGNAVVTNSTCAVRRAIENNESLTRPRPLARRGWLDLTAVSY